MNLRTHFISYMSHFTVVVSLGQVKASVVGLAFKDNFLR